VPIDLSKILMSDLNVKLLLLNRYNDHKYGFNNVRSEVLTEVTMKNAVFWDVAPCGSCMNRRFGVTYRLHHQGDKDQLARNNISLNNNRSTLRVTDNFVPCSPILLTLMMEAILSSETSRATWRNIQEDRFFMGLTNERRSTDRKNIHVIKLGILKPQISKITSSDI
jgi:hypothetical protein